MDVSGAWESTSPFMAGGWGNASLVQMGSKVSGTLGLYTVEGRVAGKQIFLMILSNGQVYYTAILEPTKDGGIAGMAVSKILADDPEAKLAERAPISLVRIPSK